MTITHIIHATIWRRENRPQHSLLASLKPENWWTQWDRYKKLCATLISSRPAIRAPFQTCNTEVATKHVISIWAINSKSRMQIFYFRHEELLQRKDRRRNYCREKTGGEIIAEKRQLGFWRAAFGDMLAVHCILVSKYSDAAVYFPNISEQCLLYTVNYDWKSPFLESQYILG